MSYKNKVVVITGAAQGIGYACAERFCRDGARVVLSDIQDQRGAEAAQDLRKAGGDACFMHCDVSDQRDVEKLIDETVRKYGKLDVMVSNAAILKTGDILELDPDDLDQVLNVNLKGFFLSGQAAARQMVKQGEGGAIINMSSVQAVITNPEMLSYAMCKGAISQLTTASALALAKHNIRVNAIGPGTILTDLAKQVMNDDTARRKIMSRTPIGRPGEPSEIASVVAFLASDDASYITGETIYVDGGRMGLNYTVPVPD